MPYFVYVLESIKTGRYYIGQTQDINNRLDQHNKGYSRSTKREIPWKLIAKWTMESRAKALKMERILKNMKSRKRVKERIEKDGSAV